MPPTLERAAWECYLALLANHTNRKQSFAAIARAAVDAATAGIEAIRPSPNAALNAGADTQTSDTFILLPTTTQQTSRQRTNHQQIEGA